MQTPEQILFERWTRRFIKAGLEKTQADYAAMFCRMISYREDSHLFNMSNETILHVSELVENTQFRAFITQIIYLSLRHPFSKISLMVYHSEAVGIPIRKILQRNFDSSQIEE